MIQIKDFPDFMMKLPEPLGWDNSFQGNKEKQDDFIVELNLPTYHNFKNFYFMDVMEGVSMHLLITQNIVDERARAEEEGLELDEEEVQAKIKDKFKEDLQNMKNNDDGIHALNEFTNKNEIRNKKAANLGKDNGISSKHVKAAR